jgi:hypothetical protein
MTPIPSSPANVWQAMLHDCTQLNMHKLIYQAFTALSDYNLLRNFINTCDVRREINLRTATLYFDNTNFDSAAFYEIYCETEGNVQVLEASIEA